MSPARKPKSAKAVHAQPRSNALLLEVAWEVCQQLGGIYTVIRSKAPSMVEIWGSQYCLIGPYNHASAAVEFEPAYPAEPFGSAVRTFQEMGYTAHYGHWLVTGRPQVVLLDPDCVYDRLNEIKYFAWDHHRIRISPGDGEVDRVLAFGFLVCEFIKALTAQRPRVPPVVAHFHEWMGGTAIPEIRRSNLPVSIVFTTHATLLGRYLAMSDQWFYDHLPFVDWQAEARRFNIETRVMLERAAAHGSHVFTTVSEVTAQECEYLLHRKVDAVLPNGLNVERFTARHESENLHKIYKERINQFVMGYFFPSYSFDLDRVLYFFTSGRYEYRNKGFDLTIDALARLNHRLRETNDDLTVVMFIITRKPFRSITADVLNNKAMLDELHNSCMAIKDQLGERLFHSVAAGQMPDFNNLVDEYWRLRLRRTMQTWRTDKLPYIVSHDMVDQDGDEVLNHLRAANLVNRPDDRVKVVYHPDFITTSNPLFGLDYDQFVRGCHLGLFPSYYEPWGYTPLECLARGIPAVTSDLAGFGSYTMSHAPECGMHGLYVAHRRYAGPEQSIEELVDIMQAFARQDLRERIATRFHAQELAEQFDWKLLGEHYHRAHMMALNRH
ncbi:MAG: glycosyltransferase [Kiritimatiellia bacterium]|nr:glycogen/starch synthase [Lentisphaerota bacterium]